MNIREIAIAKYNTDKAGRDRDDAERHIQELTQTRKELQEQLDRLFGEHLPFEIDAEAGIAELDGIRFMLLKYDWRRSLALLGECPNCHQQKPAQIWDLASLGSQLLDFKPGYHEHFRPEIQSPIKEQSSDERFCDELRLWLSAWNGHSTD